MKLTGVRRRRAHNPEDPGSKPGVAKDFFFLVYFWWGGGVRVKYLEPISGLRQKPPQIITTFTFLQLHPYLSIQTSSTIR